MNQKMFITKLQAIVGGRNATDDRAICTSYSRDQHWHFVPAKNPAYVVRPGTKEEVRLVLMLANTHKIPVIPYSTGINVRGLTIPVHDLNSWLFPPTFRSQLKLTL
jgi:FAD/FMN-containing dehydrogenase